MEDCEFHDPKYVWGGDVKENIIFEEDIIISTDPFHDLYKPKACTNCHRRIKHKVGRIGFEVIETGDQLIV